MCFENAPLCPVLFFQKPAQKMVFEKIQIWARRGPTHLGPAWAHPDAAAGAAAGRILKSRSRPLPTHPGMKYFRKETLAVDISEYWILCDIAILDGLTNQIG